MFLNVLPTMVASLSYPGLMGVMTANVPALEQGVLQGSITSLRTLSSVGHASTHRCRLCLVRLTAYASRKYTVF
jgi:hypothetical protein